ncbi:MAG: PrsW family intramembrane metalloprotease [Oscillospiraceae bacterium]|nr:PrsW family intramembrane metalloprotease [Oscillospiraceae bacterium]
MDYMIYILAICISAPLILMAALADAKSRRLLGFMILGIYIAVLASEINALLSFAFADPMDHFHITITITPVNEEILKALPLLFTAIIFCDDREILFQRAMSIGLGFAIMENTFILIKNVESVSLLWAMIRGFSSSLMHALCTIGIGIGISMIKRRRKLFVCSTFAWLMAAITYHSLYNMLVQSDHWYVGVAIPVISYIPIAIVITKKRLNTT